eukprot:gnl/TRDRNA2_/TRDRNA2_119944_c2_seq1.p1 gnl/TRDRNA2_/TRDRNA2_119944_c2~~gnl/TRDRNA2_/TRDRNA2_119944_c2_seq1.p1  ORF type:complete len:330 (+),score=38.85 gnl/TRDRNA2_/TRDRNA2_119944_c2_seq1:2-991(+)
MYVAPFTFRYHLPLYQPFVSVANVQHAIYSATGKRGAVTFRAERMALFGVWDEKENEKELERIRQFRESLESLGFAVVQSDFVPQSMALGQPRAFYRSYLERHISTLASCRYLVLVSAKPSAGQIIAEAAILGVVTLASPNKLYARLLLPPELHAATLEEALQKITALEKKPERLRLLSAVIRGRAERTLGTAGVPPPDVYLKVLGSQRAPPGVPALPARRLCAPPNVSRRAANQSNFWLFAAGHSCGAGSSLRGGRAYAASPGACAAQSRILGGRAFVFDETRRICQAFWQCLLQLPDRWDEDVFVLEGDGEHETPAISLLWHGQGDA